MMRTHAHTAAVVVDVVRSAAVSVGAVVFTGAGAAAGRMIAYTRGTASQTRS